MRMSLQLLNPERKEAGKNTSEREENTSGKGKYVPHDSHESLATFVLQPSI